MTGFCRKCSSTPGKSHLTGTHVSRPQSSSRPLVDCKNAKCNKIPRITQISGLQQWNLLYALVLSHHDRTVVALVSIIFPTPLKIQNDDRHLSHILKFSGVSGWMSVLVPAHLGSPGQRAEKWQCMWLNHHKLKCRYFITTFSYCEIWQR